MRHTDFPTGDPASADFDGDGLGNLDELQQGLDPLWADSDGDGLADGWEVANGFNPLSTDSDADEMPDGWEVTHGLAAADPHDAFQDKDGDRAPNLWEYSRSTDPADDTSVPPFDATVDSSQPSDPVGHRYATLQQAYDSLPSDTSYRALVAVLRGTHNAELTGAGAPRKVAWIAQPGGDRMTAEEGAVLKASDSLLGITLTDETVLAGLIVGDLWPNSDAAAPAITVHPDPAYAGQITEVRLVNCLVRDWRAVEYLDNFGGGALLNDGGEVWLVHTTFWNSAAWDYFDTGDRLGVIENRSGSLHVVNSIVWDGLSVAPSGIAGIPAAFIQTSVIQGGMGGAINVDPQLLGGLLTQGSTACLGAATAVGVPIDLHSEPRGTTSLNIGSDEWVDSEPDSLPDWWEMFWFGNLGQNGQGDPDGDQWINRDEYLDSTAPTYDQDADGDGLMDVREIDCFGNITEQNGTGNSDGDMANNLQEFQAGTNPMVIDPDWDQDGWLDADEWVSLGTCAQMPLMDLDGDGVNDSIDPLPLDPTVSSLSGGGSVPGPPIITLLTPPGAVPLP